MIKLVKGNIFESNAEALVNTVYTVGAMGKGVALQFKERFPEIISYITKHVKSELLSFGKFRTFQKI